MQGKFTILIFLVPAVMGECVQGPNMPDLAVEKIAGKWFSMYRSKVMIGMDYEKEYKCKSEHYAINDDGTIAVTVVALPGSGPKTSIGTGYAFTLTRNTTDGLLWHRFYEKGEAEVGASHIMDADYDHYMIFNLCTQGMDGKWIYTRSSHDPSPDVLKALEESLGKLKLTLEDFEKTPHDDCP